MTARFGDRRHPWASCGPGAGGVIGMTSQVSDVGVTGKQVRRTVAAHGVVSFVFNAALLG